MKNIIVLMILATAISSFGQQPNNDDSLRAAYFSRLKVVSNAFGNYFYPNKSKIYALPEKLFLDRINLLKEPFDLALEAYKVSLPAADAPFIEEEHRGIDYFFDRIILDYPYFHETHTGKKATLSKPVQRKLNSHLADFNNPALLTSTDFRGYIEAFLRHKTSDEVKKAGYKKSDNKRLEAYLNLIPQYFSNDTCRDFWAYHYIHAHLEDWGGKNVGHIVENFLGACNNEQYRATVDSAYSASIKARKDHLIQPYKTVDGHDLDMHIFLPDSTHAFQKRPVMVFFSGGSWTQGNPEWAFYNCAEYAKKGWVAVSVEYRLADRHETTPFEAVKDARSAIRWLRMNADMYHIDSNRIVASGNSAGGHLVLATILAQELNEASDNLRYSAAPNLLLINSGVYDLYAEEATDWIWSGLKNKNGAKKISPVHLVKSGLPPMLIIHGTNDRSVDYTTAKAFAAAMQQSGNDFEFHTLDGAPHHIWFDRRYSGNVAAIRKEFLKKRGYE